MQAFYREAFGWAQVVKGSVYVEFLMLNGQRLGLYHHEGFALNTGLSAELRAAGNTTSHVELYFHCEDIVAAAEKVATAGGRLLSKPALRDWGDEAAYYSDPEGNVLVLARSLRSAVGP